ncbi:MAG TPA: NAD-dependent epimerase/dehydratase family protein [Gaiellaceae bacterium]|nr:NAD-dependent epimerase/dehydratase family protein [Gaiellaceae bacterium]
MRVFVTGGSGVLGRALLPLLAAASHPVDAPARDELDLFDAEAVREAVAPADAVVHLATRIPPPERRADPSAWRENDRLRAEASRILVDAALAGRAAVYVQPAVTFVYPKDGAVDEETPVRDVAPHLRSALAAEAEAARFAAAGRRGVVLRLGLLGGRGADSHFGTLDPGDAGAALLAALDAPSGTYNAVRDGGRVSNRRLRETTGWRPRR